VGHIDAAGKPVQRPAPEPDVRESARSQAAREYAEGILSSRSCDENDIALIDFKAGAAWLRARILAATPCALVSRNIYTGNDWPCGRIPARHSPPTAGTNTNDHPHQVPAWLREALGDDA
jgi:hypothetical protein